MRAREELDTALRSTPAGKPSLLSRTFSRVGSWSAGAPENMECKLPGVKR